MHSPIMRCHKCQAEIDEHNGRGYCPRCFATINRGGLLWRMWQGFLDWLNDRASWDGAGAGLLNLDDKPDEEVERILREVGIGRSRASAKIVRSQKIVIDDVRSGRKMEFDRWEDVPAEYRKMMASAAGSLRDPGTSTDDAALPVPSPSPLTPQPSALNGPPDEVIDLLAGAQIDDEVERPAPMESQREIVQRQEFNRTDVHKLPAAIRALMDEFDIDIPRELRNVKGGRTQSNISLEVRTKSEGGRTVQRYVFRGPDGQERIYGSLREMPANVRKMFDRLDRPPQEGG